MPVTGMTAHHSHPRWPVIDIARGLAVCAMVAFHFTWDLGFFRIIPYDISFETEGRVLAHVIAGTFLWAVGAALVLAHRGGFEPRAFLIRFGKIAGAAAIVSVGTYFALQDEWIFFGVLHCIALSSLLALPFLTAPMAVVGLALIAAFALPALLVHPALDQPWLYWLGLNQTIPRTNDYVPFLPWFGVVLGGMLATRAVLASSRLATLAEHHANHRPARVLTWLGRRALPIYLLHQPILMALLWALVTVAGPRILNPAIDPAFMQSCTLRCETGGQERPRCEAACACIGRKLTLGSGTSDEFGQDLKQTIDYCRKDAGI